MLWLITIDYKKIARRTLSTTVLLLGFVLLSNIAPQHAYAKKAKPLSTVADLRYGVVLYDYFQGDHFGALSELMVAKERGGIQGHKDNPELIEGSINLAFGMDRRAGAIFTRLLDDNKPLAVRNAAWFYLSKIRYQRGEFEQVRASLEQIKPPISPDLKDEMAAMDIQLLMRDSQFDEAKKRLAKANSGKRFQYWEPYLHFNLGAVLARLEKVDEAQTLFSKVIKQGLTKDPSFHPEQLSLYDRALTASAFGYFQEDDYDKAVNQFASVRQNTPLANDALLGYGWAKARQGDYQGALAPWLHLVQKPRADDAVQEALIAIPYAYLQLGDVNKAISSYAEAEQIFVDELNHIDDIGTQILSQSMVEILSLDDMAAQYSWLAPETNDLVAAPSRYLLPLFSYNRFQNSVQAMVDLYRVYRRLDAWKSSLDAYRDLMDYRLRAFRLNHTSAALSSSTEGSKSAEGSEQSKNFQKLSAEFFEVKAQRDRLTILVNKAKDEQNVFLFLDEDRLDLLDMVQSAERNLQILAAADEYIEEEAEWVERYRGMLLWSATMDFDDRLWQVQAKIDEVDKALESSTRADVNIKTLLNEAPDITAAQSRIDEFSRRVDSLLADNNRLMASFEENLRAQIFASLAVQRQRVQFYLGEARLAVAQLYDNHYLKNKDQEE